MSLLTLCLICIVHNYRSGHPPFTPARDRCLLTKIDALGRFRPRGVGGGSSIIREVLLSTLGYTRNPSRAAQGLPFECSGRLDAVEGRPTGQLAPSSNVATSQVSLLKSRDATSDLRFWKPLGVGGWLGVGRSL